MDWKKTFTLGTWVIHGFFAITVLAGTGLTFFALRLNHLQSTEEERNLKINSLIHDLKSDASFEKMGKYLSRAEAIKAQDKMRELGSRIAETESLLEMKSSKELSTAMRTFNGLINNTSGMSDPKDALKVLRSKVDGLYAIAQARKYKNVSIISERMKDRLEQLNSNNVGGSILVSYLKTDLKRLETLVSSALEGSEKADLMERFQSMAQELDLLSSLNSQSRTLKQQVTQASLALMQWGMDAEKRSKDSQKLSLQKQNLLVLSLAGLIGFIITAWMGFAYLFRWQKGKMGTQVELEVKGVIEKGIMGDQRFMMDHYSELTRNDIVRLLDELKLKLNLGSMLHSGLPFAGCLVDQSFKLTWHNQLFLEQFYLSEEEVRSDSFNWDYLREYLNLDEDPVYQALVNKISGIYPVKIKQDEYTPMQPFEMYVTPITINREDRVMIFFYPLVSVKEAITEQVNLSRDTLNRFVTLWNEEKLDEDELKLLEKDFINNELVDVFGMLKELHERITTEKEECYRTIRNHEEERVQFLAEITSWEQAELKKRDIIREEFKLTSEMRDTFIQSLERGESLVQINKSVMQQNDDLRTEAMRLQNRSIEAQKKQKETTEIMAQLEGVKTDYKKLKLELLEVKTRLISINNSLFGQLPPLDEAQQRLASRYKDELARLDFNVATLDKKLSQLDVILGKLAMMNEKAHPEQALLNFQTTQKDHAEKETLIQIQKALALTETKLIDNFKQLHHLLKQDLNAHGRGSENSTDSYLS